MPEPESDWRDYYTEIPIKTAVLNILLWGTVLGGFAITIVFQVARFLIVRPIFGYELISGDELGTITFSMAFVCSIGYAIYSVNKELQRRDDCKRRGLKLRKD